MVSIGVRKLKEQTSRVLRLVQEEGVEVEITHRGKVVARIVPALSGPSYAGAATSAWSDLDRLASEISAHWPADVSAEDAVQEQRREL